MVCFERWQTNEKQNQIDRGTKKQTLTCNHTKNQTSGKPEDAIKKRRQKREQDRAFGPIRLLSDREKKWNGSWWRSDRRLHRLTTSRQTLAKRREGGREEWKTGVCQLYISTSAPVCRASNGTITFAGRRGGVKASRERGGNQYVTLWPGGTGGSRGFYRSQPVK